MIDPSHRRGVSSLPRLILLFIFLASIYAITYSGDIETGDTRVLFDAVSSLVDHGDDRLDLAAWMRPPQTFDVNDSYPLVSANVEPLQVILATPLYLIAKMLPFGLVHTVWLFNLLIGAAAGCTFYLYARTLGYNEQVSILGAVLLGVGTLIFPYTRTFFREPLAMLLLLVAALCLEKSRHANHVRWLVAALIAFAGVLLTKNSTLLAIPALFVIALPSMKLRHLPVRTLIIGGVVLIGVLLIVSGRFNALDRLGGEYVGIAMQAYLLSPGGSVWGTSPILLLAFPGAVLLMRRRQWRYPVAVMVLTLAFAFGYALLSGRHWFGGLSMPPRFLIPVIPFWMLLALPVLEQAVSRKRLIWSALVVVLIGYTLWVQLSAISLPLGAYPDALPPESNGLIEWSGGLNDPRWLRWVVIPSLWGRIPFDFAWVLARLPLWGVGFEVIATLSGAAMLFKPTRVTAVVAASAFVIALSMGLISLNRIDPRYAGQDEVLYQALTVLERETDKSDIILLSSPRYEAFFHNQDRRWNGGRVITLPLQPGERSSPEQPPLVTSDNPAVLLDRYTIPWIYNLAATRDRLWLFVDGSPELWWSVRPVEQFMSSRFYSVRVMTLGSFTRLIEYRTVSTPQAELFRSANYATAFVFGDAVRLDGFELPLGTVYHAGEVVPISLYWTTAAPLQARYTAAVYIRDAEGAPIAQHDSPPGGGFAPTDTWRIGVPVWDHHGIRLPSNLPTGAYQVWVKLYDFAPDGAVRDLPISGGDVMDGVIAVLPITLMIE